MLKIKKTLYSSLKSVTFAVGDDLKLEHPVGGVSKAQKKRAILTDNTLQIMYESKKKNLSLFSNEILYG